MVSNFGIPIQSGVEELKASNESLEKNVKRMRLQIDQVFGNFIQIWRFTVICFQLDIIIQQEFTKGYTLVFRILTTAVATLLGINWFLVADLKEDT